MREERRMAVHLSKTIKRIFVLHFPRFKATLLDEDEEAKWSKIVEGEVPQKFVVSIPAGFTLCIEKIGAGKLRARRGRR